MKTKNLKKEQMYYCLIGENWYPIFAIVKAKYIGIAGYPGNHDLVFMEQKVDGIVHRFEIETENIYPPDKKIISAVIHNERQGRRIIEHDKTYDHTNAKEKIEGWIATLLETDQKALRAKFRSVYPNLVKVDGSFLVSRFKMKNWDEVMHLYWTYKYPKITIPKFE